MKEEEKLERTIRGLSKLPENRRCINCNSLGPQYVCTTFNTFICQICSGIHREFTHRVKSISMAKFSQDEVNALQAGGNERARLIFFKEYDSQRRPQPDSSNMYKLRDFIKHVYVDKRFTGETSLEQLPRLRLTDREEFTESRKSVSPRSDGQYDRHYSGRSSPSGRSEDSSYRYYYDERRSPRYPRDNARSGGYRRSPIKFEVVDDRFRDDSGRGRRSLAQRPPESQRNADDRSTCSTPTKKELPGHNAGARSSITSSGVKKVPSAGNLRSTDGNEAKQKVAAPAEALAVVSDDKKPTETPMEPQKQQVTPSADNKSVITSNSSRKKSTLEELLFELSVPAPIPLENSFEGIGSVIPQSTEPQAGPQIEPPVTSFPGEITSQAATGLASKTAETLQSTPDVSLQPSEGPSSSAPDKAAESRGEMSRSIQQIPPPSTLPKDEIALKDQEMFQSEQPLFLTNNEDEPPVNPSENIVTAAPETSIPEAPQQPVVEQTPANTTAVPATGVIDVPQPPAVEQMPASARRELPADLFTALYPPAHATVHVWRTGASPGMGFNMQYYPQMMPPSPANSASASSKTTNPFDIDDGANITQGPTFPSMTPLQGSLPNATSASYGLRPDLSQAAPSEALMQSQPPAYSPFLLNQSPYATGPSVMAGMQNNTQRFGMHGFSGHGSDSPAASSTMNYSAPGTTNTFPSSGGGNPFD